MPLEVQEGLIGRGLRVVDRQKWMERVEGMARRRKPARTRMKPSRGNLYTKRNKRIAILEGAARQVLIVIDYTRTQDGRRKRYVVQPYSYRYKRFWLMGVGGNGRRRYLRKALFARDVDDRKKPIKSFVLRFIGRVALTDNKFRPHAGWPIEIG